MYLVAMATLVLGACSQEEMTNKDNDNAASAFVLTATHEGLAPTHKGSAPTRTTLESGDAVNWDIGDQIKLVWNGGNVTSSPLTSAGSTARFSFASNPGEGNVYAVYPASITASYDGSTFSVTVPATQDGTFANAAIEVSELSGGTDLNFKNLGSLLEIGVTASDTRSIVIGTYGGAKIAGTAPVTFSAGVPVVGEITGGTTVTLNVSGAGTYYAALLPVNASEGFYVELHDAADGGGNIIAKKIGRNALNLPRKKLKELGEIGESEVLAQWSFINNAATMADLAANWHSGNISSNSTYDDLTDVIGNTGEYIYSTDKGSTMTFYQVDKTSFSNWTRLYLYTLGQPGFTSIWLDDAFQFDVDNDTALSLGATIMMSFVLRIPSELLGCYMLEYYANDAWHPVDDPDCPVQSKTISAKTYNYNIQETVANDESIQTYYFPLKHSISAHSLKIRIRASAPYTCGGSNMTEPSINTKQGRFRGESKAGCISPVIKVTR